MLKSNDGKNADSRKRTIREFVNLTEDEDQDHQDPIPVLKAPRVISRSVSEPTPSSSSLLVTHSIFTHNILSSGSEANTSDLIYRKTFIEFICLLGKQADREFMANLLFQIADIYSSESMFDLIKSLLPIDDHKRFEKKTWHTFRMSLYSDAGRMGHESAVKRITSLVKKHQSIDNAAKSAYSLDDFPNREDYVQTISGIIENQTEELKVFWVNNQNENVRKVLAQALYKISKYCLTKNIFNLDDAVKKNISNFFKRTSEILKPITNEANASLVPPVVSNKM